MIFGELDFCALLAGLDLVDDLIEGDLEFAECTGECQDFDEVAVVVSHLDGVEEFPACTDHRVCLHDDIAELGVSLDAFPLLLRGYIISDDDCRDTCCSELFAGTCRAGENPVGGDHDTKVRFVCLQVGNHTVNICRLEFCTAGRHECLHVFTVCSLIKKQFCHYTTCNIA